MSFFITCGRGMDYFVVKELSGLGQVRNLESTDGKVFFEVAQSEVSSHKLSFLLNLKSVERLFVTVCKRESDRNALEGLMNNLIAWHGAYDIWSALKNKNRCEEDHSDISASPDQSPQKKIKSEDSMISRVTFRISCKCAGRVSRIFSIKSITKQLNEEVQQYLGWHPDLKDPILEIYVHMNDIFTVIGLSVCEIPLSKRPYLKSINLRSTVCWAMAYSADIKHGDIILDPMCGSGTVVIEVLKSWPISTVIGVDSCGEQVQQAIKNCTFADILGKSNLMHGSVEALPIKSEFVNVVLCDFPFGRKHGTVETVKTLLPKALQEINRVCKVDGRIVILISQQLVNHLYDLISELFPRKASAAPLIPFRCRVPSGTNPSSTRTSSESSRTNHAVFWKQQSKNYVKLGDLGAYICAFSKKKCG